MPTEILILGAGAIGAFFASRLALAPDVPIDDYIEKYSSQTKSTSQSRAPSTTTPTVNVSVICRSNYPSVSKAGGFQIHSPTFKDNFFRPTRIYASPTEASRSNIPWDYIIVATKALNNPAEEVRIVRDLTRNVGSSGRGSAVVLIQNGVGVEGSYAAEGMTVLSAVTAVSAEQPTHGMIQHNRWTRISIGPYTPSSFTTTTTNTTQTTPQQERTKSIGELALTSHLCHLLRSTGIHDADPHSHEELQLIRWHKLAINAAFNPAAVLTDGAANAGMVKDSEMYMFLEAVMWEVLEAGVNVLDLGDYHVGGEEGSVRGKVNEVYTSRGLALPEKTLASIQRNTSGSRASMWGDWEQGREMEVDAILGNAMRFAREKGFDMPRVQALFALLVVKDGERRRRREEMEKKKIGEGGSKL